MARISRLLLGLLGALAIVACVGVATGAFAPDVDVIVENDSFDMVTVRVFCSGAQAWRFSNVVPASTERRRLRLSRCVQVDILVSYFAQPRRDIYFDRIFPVHEDSEIRVKVGNAEATTWWSVRE